MTWGLRDALIGEHKRLYQTNATFHASVNVLTQLLPSMVNGLAAEAKGVEADVSDRIERMLGGSGPQVTLADIFCPETKKDRQSRNDGGG